MANEPDSLVMIDDPQRVQAHRFPPETPIVAGSWEDHNRKGPNADGPNEGPTIAIAIKSKDKSKFMPAKTTSGLHIIMRGEHKESGETWTVGPQVPLQPEKSKMGSEPGRYIFALKPPERDGEGKILDVRERDDGEWLKFYSYK